uniref:Uncharacterized protein n=2 Tax=Arion vulgaris TaxID=1028688 RepID=A0A0B7BKW2_9EUPU
MNYSRFEEFCGGPFWNSSLLLNNWWPQFTPCFINTILVWVPCGYVWLLLPYFLHDVHNKLSVNILHPTKTDGDKRNVACYPQKSSRNVSPLPVLGTIQLSVFGKCCSLVS